MAEKAIGEVYVILVYVAVLSPTGRTAENVNLSDAQ